MPALVEVLYPVPDVRRTPLTLLKWWESRRLLYNQVVGTTGVFTLTAVTLLSMLPGGPPVPNGIDLGIGAVAFGVAANSCYTLGWMAEMVARRVWGHRAPYLGPILFREGLIFSVGLTLLPAVVVSLFTVAGLFLKIVG